MRLYLIVLLILGVFVPNAGADITDEPGANFSSRCVVVFTDTFKYDQSMLPQEKTDASLWKRVTVAVCWWKGQDNYTIRSGEHLFREYVENGKLVREGVGSWSLAPRVYLQKSVNDGAKEWEGGAAVMIDATPFDDPYKEE